MNSEEKEILDIIIEHYEKSIHKVGDIIEPLISTHRELLNENKDLEKVLLSIIRTNLESFGFIRDLKNMMKDPNF